MDLQLLKNCSKAYQILNRIWTYIKVNNSIADYTCDQMNIYKNDMLKQGHSNACATAIAAHAFGYLDGNISTVVKMSGGCSMCGN